ncbi:uncharacterized protein KY384_003095 [Bacidia gigantensis]|uniref:uncharacterized protein n=1 Tax=Bacidia gigantensis TaxID=2732470 RepID=UPI001D04B06D|nr:uncharacterized protein KY384_003095 [Bacidia gigantensis]KAG8531466.1 hypothetical protein KY384_003095 [Bacidia gigantensis]
MERDFYHGFGGGNEQGGFRKPFMRRNVTDYGSSMVQWMRYREQRYRGGTRLETERPFASHVVDMLPPGARNQTAADAIPPKMLHSSLNKIKHPINIVKWTPEGRRLLTGSSSGEFTLWNGMAFNFETILQAHDSAIRAAVYSHNEDWLISADQDGVVKYWQTNFNNVKVMQAHLEAIRDIAFSPNDSKFVTACDDRSLNIFDFAEGAKESSLLGHNWDVKAVDWHPTKGLLVSGSKDHQVKLWDPRTGRCLTTLHGHKNTIARTKFEPTRGQLLATCARDQTARVFDLRMMRDICLLKGNEKDISTLAWHPTHASLLSTGGADGSIYHYLLDEPNAPTGTATSIPPYDSLDPSNAPAQTIYPAHKVQYAHDFSVWSLDWHPLGHILASGSNDRVTRFWTRARPGETDCFNDRYHLGEDEAAKRGTWDKRGGRKMMHEIEQQELEDEAEGLEDQQMPVKQSGLPGLPGLSMAINGEGNGMRNGNPQPHIRGGAGMPPPISDEPNAIASMDPERFKALMASGGILPPPPLVNGQNPGLPPPPFPNFDPSKFPPGMFPPPPPQMYPTPAGTLPPPPGNPGVMNVPEIAGDNGSTGSLRRRGPLPSQQESLMMEQQRNRFRPAR